MAAERAQGAGDYQLTATIFGGPPPQCGNGVREFDETCDGAADDARCDGLCQPGCTCPPPICGNDVQEQGEACDGTLPAGGRERRRGHRLGQHGPQVGVEERRDHTPPAVAHPPIPSTA